MRRVGPDAVVAVVVVVVVVVVNVPVSMKRRIKCSMWCVSATELACVAAEASACALERVCWFVLLLFVFVLVLVLVVVVVDVGGLICSKWLICVIRSAQFQMWCALDTCSGSMRKMRGSMSSLRSAAADIDISTIRTRQAHQQQTTKTTDRNRRYNHQCSCVRA